MSESRIGPIVLLILSFVLALLTIIPALFLVMATAGCRDGCSLQVVEVGIWIAVLGPWVALAIGATVTIVRMVRRQRALIAALVTIGATFAAFILGVAWTFIAIG